MLCSELGKAMMGKAGKQNQVPEMSTFLCSVDDMVAEMGTEQVGQALVPHELSTYMPTENCESWNTSSCFWVTEKSQ